MNFPVPGNKAGLGTKLAVCCAAGFFALGAEARDLTFDQRFSDKGEPAALHYRASFTNASGTHQLEAWRDGRHRLKRRTDDVLETYVTLTEGEAEYRLDVLDLKKKIHTVIDRSNLYRIGNFTDWFDLAHGLRHPKGEYRLENGIAPKGAPRAIDACNWVDLMQQERTTHICWSDATRLPLLMVTQEGQTVWKIDAVDRKAVPAKIFEIHDEGFIRNDANQDIERD